MTETVDYRNTLGTHETNGLVNGLEYHKEQAENMHPTKPDVDWTEPGLRITRLRLVSDPGYPMWDVSYCYGTLDGYTVKVGLPFSQLPKNRMMNAIIEHAKRAKVYAKRLGILDNISKLC